MGVSILPALLVLPAFAGAPNTEGIAWLFGDVSIANAPVSQATFGGRRMEWNGNKYKNDLPRYQLVGRSLEVAGSDVYVGPVTLTLRELTDSDALAYNYQKEEDSKQPSNEDIDLAKAANITWADYDPEEVWNPYDPTSDMYTSSIFTKVAGVIGQDDAVYTAPGVHLFATRDSSKDAASMTFDNTTAKVNGSTIKADKVTIKNGSVLTFVNETELSLPDFAGGDIDSTGLTTLNANTINIDGSVLEVKPGAKFVLNPTTSATIKNVVTNAYGAWTVNGGGYIETNGKSLTFDSNKTKEHGAALYYKDQAYDGNDNGDRLVLNTKNITFSNNEVIATDKEVPGSGGAIFATGGVVHIAGETNTFAGNQMNGKIKSGREFKVGGGAIANQSYAVENGTNKDAPIDADMIIGKEDGSSVNIFTSNTSKTNGGAIMNRAVDTDGDARLLIDGKTTFKNNHADINGGAIYNIARDGKTAYMFLFGANTFSGNTAGDKGGAIYNEGTMVLSGVNNFTGNMVGTGETKVANDIHNLGIVNIAGGKTTLDGGITGDGTLTIAEGATLNIGKATITQGTINLGGTLVADLVDGADPIFNVSTLFKDDGGKLRLAIEKEGTYNLFSDKQFAKAQTQVTSSVYDLDWETIDGSVIATKKSVAKIVEDTGLGTQSAATLSHIADSAAIETSPKQMRDLSLRLQEKLAEAEANPAAKAEVEHATKAIHPETESVAQSVSSSVQNTVVSLASSRMAAPSVGRNGGDVELTAGGVWAQGLFNKSKQNDAFNGYTRGIAVGMDGTLNKHWTVGAGYSFAHSDIDATARNTEIDSNTVFLYGQYKPAAWYLNAIANYTWSDYSEKGTVIDDALVFADYDVSSFGGALNAGYDFDNGITPELGLRYMHVNSYDYSNSYGINNRVDASDYLTGVLGAKYAFSVAAGKHATFLPQLNAGIKYDLLSDKSMSTVTMPGVNAYTLEGERLNRVGGEFGIGLGMQYDNLNVSVNYDIDVRKDYTSQTGMLKLRYNF